MSTERSEVSTAWRRAHLRALAAVALLMLTACAAGPVYKPKGPDDTVGYTDQQLTTNRYRVTFTGNSAVKRPEVEDYLMRRAAEVTLGAGYTHFIFDTRDTKASTYYRSTFDNWDPRFGGGIGYDRGFGRGGFYGARWGGLRGGPGYFGDDITPVTRYSAYSEIVMLTPQQAAGNPRAISARDVLAHLTAPVGVPPPPPGAPPPPPPGVQQPSAAAPPTAPVSPGTVSGARRNS
jgi:hypothetical protein